MSAGNSYFRVVYDTTGVPDAGTQIGGILYFQDQGATPRQPVTVVGIVPSLAAGTYEFKLQAYATTPYTLSLYNCGVNAFIIPE